MKVLSHLIQKAENSPKYLWLLNRIMNHVVRFNKPHGFQVIKIEGDRVETFAPYRKKNFNHVNGIHACAIATVGELSAGIVLMYHFSPQAYRIILSTIHIDYHFQAKKDITATASLIPAEKSAIVEQLAKEGKTVQTVTTTIKDSDQQTIATVQTQWQIKPWKDVKTKV